jgi:hypothetical protein
VVVPLALLALAGRRAGRARLAVGLGRVDPRRAVGAAVAVGALGALVALAAAQPVWRAAETTSARADAAAWVVVDTSRSMLAAGAPGAEDRLARARRVALRVRDELADVPVGLASLSDRALPHLFPSPDRDAFARALARAIRGGHPQPTGLGESGTDLTALAALPTRNFFAAATARRVAVVLTDGETAPVDPDALDAAFRAVPRTALLLVHVGRRGERVYDANGLPEPEYEPPSSDGAAAVRSVASLTAGSAYDESDAGAVAAAARAAVGADGPTAELARGERRTPLAPWVLAAAVVPLAFLVRRRNVDR